MKMELGHIYSISYGESVQLIVRYKESDCTQHYFLSNLHYWNGYEKYLNGGYCVNSSITEIREATTAEKQLLVRFEIANNTL